MALGSHCSCVVPEKRERSPGSWGLERAPAGAPRGRWRSTEIIDLFLLESCAVDATQGSLRSGRPAMGAFLASKPNPQYRATERAHGRGPGAGVCVWAGRRSPPRRKLPRAWRLCARMGAHAAAARVGVVFAGVRSASLNSVGMLARCAPASLALARTMVVCAGGACFSSSR